MAKRVLQPNNDQAANDAFDQAEIDGYFQVKEDAEAAEAAENGVKPAQNEEGGLDTLVAWNRMTFNERHNISVMSPEEKAAFEAEEAATEAAPELDTTIGGNDFLSSLVASGFAYWGAGGLTVMFAKRGTDENDPLGYELKAVNVTALAGIKQAAIEKANKNSDPQAETKKSVAGLLKKFPGMKEAELVAIFKALSA